MKTVEDITNKKPCGHVVSVLRVTVGLLAICIVVMVCAGVWFAHSMTKSYNKKDYFVISINHGEAMTRETVSVDVEQQSEFIVIHDSDSRLIKSIIFIDFKNSLVAVYRSRMDDCWLVSMGDDLVSFEEEYDLIISQNGTVVEEPERVYYDTKERVRDQADIPQDMSNYCSTSNSYWLEKAASDGRVKRQTVHVGYGSDCCWCWTSSCICQCP